MQPIYLVCGVPGSGKSWVCEQLLEKFEYIHHDGYIYLKQPGAYVKAILEIAPNILDKPILCEAPFSVNETKDPLEKSGYKVIPVFIIEDEFVLKARYQKREGKPIPQGHLTRTKTYFERAKKWNAMYGTSDEVLKYLRSV